MSKQGPSRPIRVALVGLGNVHQALLQILAAKQQRLAQDHKIDFRIVCAADSTGVAVHTTGFDPTALRAMKIAGGSVSGLPEFQPQQSAASVLDHLEYDLLFEASPVDLTTGGPALPIVHRALGRAIPVVLANKGPLVVDFIGLHTAAKKHGTALKYSATVCGGLPIMNIVERDMITADIGLMRGVFNSTTNFVLDEIAQGTDYDVALQEAQRRGIAEADPSLDVNGWDTANKLLIIANTVMGTRLTLDDIEVTGIADINVDDVREQHRLGNSVKLVATASEGSFTVAPATLSPSDFLAGCNGWEMGIEIHTDIYGINYFKLWEREPVPTAASMLRDAINILV